jgi:hypothetical protein
LLRVIVDADLFDADAFVLRCRCPGGEFQRLNETVERKRGNYPLKAKGRRGSDRHGCKQQQTCRNDAKQNAEKTAQIEHGGSPLSAR